jgi:cytidylate kinase
MIIAIDGPAASGKSSIARMIAAHFGLPRLDTGCLYRAVAREVMLGGHDLNNVDAASAAARALDPAGLNDPDLRTKGYGEAASVVAAIPAVREALLGFQRDFAGQPGGAVIEGRDIGTVVCPNADAKLFLTATAESRARRRYLELKGYGMDITEERVLREIQERDHRDTTRAISPLRKADDAHLLDTTELDIEKAFLAAVDLIGAVPAGR